MGFLGGEPAVRLLKALSPTGRSRVCPDDVPSAYENKSKLEALFGARVGDEVRGKVVVDFGCGRGHEIVELAERGAARVIGIEVNPRWIDKATRHIAQHGFSDRCVVIAASIDAGAAADVIICLDSFEHFENPEAVLGTMHRLLKPGGCVLVAFGPLWYHPYGGHLFSVFPYAHLIFSEYALVTWRSSLPGKSATSSVLESGINKMTVKRFVRLVEDSPLKFASFEAVPIRRLKWMRFAGLRELTTSIVRCRLESRS